MEEKHATNSKNSFPSYLALAMIKQTKKSSLQQSKNSLASYSLSFGSVEVGAVHLHRNETERFQKCTRKRSAYLYLKTIYS